MEHLLGDFTFAVWDGPRQRLFCARDHLGVRPFYYAQCGAAIVFSRGLDSPTALESMAFNAESILYARDGKTILARFSQGGERREVVGWEDIPAILADATTAVEDRTFWTNTGVDPLGFVSAAVDTLAALFPDRRAIGVPARGIIVGGGSFHCSSQQVPA